MIVFRPLEATFPRFDGFEDGKIPLFPSEYTFKITTSTGPKKIVSRRQYNLTASYAFTLYKGQGQTISSVLVDLRKPPPPITLTTFAAYVVLSRSRGHDTI